ncbi:hypothetical protein GTQ34_09295 [Muricauda sp. JGD-17]|uniref:Uncharacterized protein n=1 Tax=Flagellimonas ochracea TaxID=2696472 RepID=A0A964TDA0_9FLAO|nr:hypothetical protein [Allomuricauda ochracea]NAY92114.1 hypothetical protein [Allomuricauda ochracea]
MVPGIAAALIGDPVYAQGVATFTLEILGHAQSETKIKRVESLLFGLEELLKKHDPKFEFEKSSSQEVRDLLETAIINASRANTESKIERLRKVVFGHIVDPQPYDYTTRYLDLGVRLNDDQVLILKMFVETEVDLHDLREKLKDLRIISENAKDVELAMFASDSKASSKQKEVFKYKKDIHKKEMENTEFDFESVVNKRRRMISKYPEDEFQFLFNDLRVLGLIYNPAEGRASNTGDQAYYQCTALANGFMKYLSEDSG